MARHWYHDSDNSDKDRSSTESDSSDTDLTEPEDEITSDMDLTESEVNTSNADLSETEDEIASDTALIKLKDETFSNAEGSVTPSHRISLEKVAIYKSRRYEDPSDNPTQNLSDIDPDFIKSDNTKKLQLRIVDRWHRFCKVKVKEKCRRLNWSKPEAALRRASADWLYRFLHWCCRLQYGKDNRVCKGYGSADSLKTDWKYLRGYYQRVKKRRMKKSMATRLRTGIAQLIVEFNLRTQPRKNDPVYIEDMIPFNETILRTREKRFYLGIQRIMLCLALMLGLFTASRKTAILKLQYKHLRLSLQRNPHGGPPVLSIDIEPEYIKQLLGTKALNTFSFPEIIYGVSLVFSPHVFIMGLLFHANAFQTNIKSMDDLRRLFVMRGCQQLELPLKKEMDDYYLFCKVEEIEGEPRIIREEPMSDGAFYAAIKSISFIMGLLNVFFFHQFRYGTGKLLDKTGWVSDSERNLIMNHADTSTFLKHYRPRNHTQMQQVVFGLDADQPWDRALNSMNRNKDKRRPRFLDDTEKALVESDPELQAAIRELDSLQDDYERNPIPELASELAQAQGRVLNTRQRLRYKRLAQVRRDFGPKQAVIDANGQLDGTILPDDGAVEVLPEDDMPLQQVRLVEGLTTVPTVWTLEGEWQRRNVGVEVVTMYCDFQEGGPLRGRPKRKQNVSDDDTSKKAAKRSNNVENDKLAIAKKKHEQDQKHVKTARKPLICFQCGKKFSQHQSLLRHFRPKHLNDQMCNFCADGKEYLEQMHWQNHAAAVHRLNT
ncbi:C2H2 finger domain protein, putative [Talaromyces stipitatus ATCC 10500]|uniref:C2H2 finger domain protein, putative n=1 Tax=Talaromyces stipitatus (strain ATCC 10500 / CBS 375.48 / QM 6759 / NRRL 1006) TaxID=441959 RepID=B8LZZ1_TALSN|nr:C2H2 finger domain protein, putative [Talaromyces stipitatus ATCC 10500]EED20923.1 C2H2 finger domain protein, putative [Talaromyces stipitatus ATCC 10500]